MSGGEVGGEGGRLLFLLPPSQALLCTGCRRLFDDPVISIQCGHTFCRPCAAAMPTCPVDGKPLSAEQVIPNIAVSGQIDDLQVVCPYAALLGDSTSTDGGDAGGQGPASPWAPASPGTPTSLKAGAHLGQSLWTLRGEHAGVLDPTGGCTEVLPYSALQDHVAGCTYAPVACPNAPDLCGPMRQCDLGAHLAVCPNVACKYAPLGCTARGTRADITEHEEMCEAGTDPAVRQTKTLSKLRSLYDTLQAQVHALEAKLEQSVETQERLDTNTELALGRIETLESRLKGKRRARVPTARAPAAQVPNGPPISNTGTPRRASTKPTGVGRFSKVSDAVGDNSELTMPFNFQCIGTFEAHTGTVWNVATWEGLLFTTGSDNRIVVWDLAAAQPTRRCELAGHHGVVHSMVVHGGFLFSGDSERTIRMWDLATFEEVKSWEASNDIVCALAVLGGKLFSASYATIRVWSLQDIMNGRPVQCIHTLKKSLNHWVRALRTDGQFLYSVCHDMVHVWDPELMQCRSKLDTQFGTVHSLAVTQAFIICGTYNQNIHIYNKEDLSHIQQLKGHLGTVHALSVSVTGQFLFSASVDATIKVWNLENMLIVQTLLRHEASVNALHWHNNLLFSGSADHRVKIFQPFKGKAAVTTSETPNKLLVGQGYEACWGSGQLPARLPASPVKRSLKLGQTSYRDV